MLRQVKSCIQNGNKNTSAINPYIVQFRYTDKRELGITPAIDQVGIIQAWIDQGAKNN